MKIVALVACSLIVSISWTARAGGDREECRDVSREEIVSTVDRELRRRFGDVERWEEREIKIWRDGCNYYYSEEEVPQSPGTHILMIINQDGEVIDYFPGA